LTGLARSSTPSITALGLRRFDPPVRAPLPRHAYRLATGPGPAAHYETIGRILFGLEPDTAMFAASALLNSGDDRTGFLHSPAAEGRPDMLQVVQKTGSRQVP
jgi:hypothetical protein